MAALGSACISRVAAAEGPAATDEDLRNLRVLEVTEAGRRCVIIVPRYLSPGQELPLVVLLHGLGETVDERMGAYAWLERYGLGSAWQRLKRAPLARTSARGEWTEPRLAAVNEELAARPFRGFVMACPFMPNPRGAADLEAYARWLEQSLLPRVRKEVPVRAGRDHTFLCGVSLGGYVSLEVLLRAPRVFGAWAGVQTAISSAAIPGYAQRIAALEGSTTRPLLLLTSTQDTFRASSEALARAFRDKLLEASLLVVPGPHDQPWLREAGSIEALLWLDRIGYRAAATSR